MSRNKLKTNPITTLNMLLICLREEVNASQWDQVEARLNQMRTIAMRAAIAEDSPQFRG